MVENGRAKVYSSLVYLFMILAFQLLLSEGVFSTIFIVKNLFVWSIDNDGLVYAIGIDIFFMRNANKYSIDIV